MTLYRQPQPARRSLKIFAFDPMLGLRASNRIAIDVANEPLLPGPRGERVEIIDYDGALDCYYEPVNLDDPAILMQGGLDPSSSDPRFHQQMVYAVATRVLENFDRALGRRMKFRGKKPLLIVPHAFQEANAYYDPSLGALLFGYFQADDVDPGVNIPGQTVFTCLSQDIIAHETTHAIVDQLRPRFREPTNPDVAAFHEGFSDIVAIFQHFTFPGVLRESIARQRGDLRSSSPLVELAAQLGHAKGGKAALRTAIAAPDPRMYEDTDECHDRGAILVAAVFDGFFRTYQARIADLLRIATGGTGRLPDGELHPDLINRLADCAAETAQQVLTMCIRAFDYLPPIDVTFDDYLRAMVTADFELSGNETALMRGAMIEAFRARGIYAKGVSSLAEEALRWEQSGMADFPVAALPAILAQQARDTASRRASTDEPSALPKPAPKKKRAGGRATAAAEFPPDVPAGLYPTLHRWGVDNATHLGLDPKQPIAVTGFHPAFRVGRDGGLHLELIAQFVQTDPSPASDLGGIRFRAGATVIAGADGRVRYAVLKPMVSGRRDAYASFVAACDAQDARLAWEPPKSAYRARRIAARMDAAALHTGRI